MLYTHKDINNNSITNTGGTNEFISFYLKSLAAQGKRHKLSKHTLTILCLLNPPRTALLVVSKISTYFCRSRPKLCTSSISWPSLLICKLALTLAFTTTNWLNCRGHLHILFHNAHLLPIRSRGLFPLIYTGASLIDSLVKGNDVTSVYISKSHRCASLPHLLIVWLIISSLLPHKLHLLFSSVPSIFHKLKLFVMALFYAVINRRSVSLFRILQIALESNKHPTLLEGLEGSGNESVVLR